MFYVQVQEIKKKIKNMVLRLDICLNERVRTCSQNLDLVSPKVRFLPKRSISVQNVQFWNKLTKNKEFL